MPWQVKNSHPSKGPLVKRIDDTGKIWRPGRFSPEAAVRVNEKVFVLGREEGENSQCLAEEDALLVDLHDREKGCRRARRFPYALKPLQKATLFNGFTRTPHGDVGVIVAEDPGVVTVVMEGEAYQKAGASRLSSLEFFRAAGFGGAEGQ